MPAQAGTHAILGSQYLSQFLAWIPASAGMTSERGV